MMTLAEWQNTRRVDHLNLPGGNNLRFRSLPSPLANLKTFDADVNALTTAGNNFDRVTVLGRLLQQTTAYLSLPSNTVPDRYTNAVRALDREVRNDLNQITGGATSLRRFIDDIVALRGAPHSLTPKVVRLNIFYLVAVDAAPDVREIDQTINDHIARVNNAAGYRRARITFARTNAAATLASQDTKGGSILLSAVDPTVPAHARGKFADGGLGARRLIKYCNASNGAAGSIDVGTRSRAEGDCRSTANPVRQHESRSSRHRARGNPAGRVGVVGPLRAKSRSPVGGSGGPSVQQGRRPSLPAHPCAASSGPSNSCERGRPCPWRTSPRPPAPRTRASSRATTSASSASGRGSSGRPQEPPEEGQIPPRDTGAAPLPFLRSNAGPRGPAQGGARGGG